MTSYQCSIVTLGPGGTIVELQAIKISRTIIPNKNSMHVAGYIQSHIRYAMQLTSLVVMCIIHNRIRKLQKNYQSSVIQKH